ncbi:hypothetical protein Glove_396g97 [Diversispora epigaea]|uniref:Cas12f1-like TNB domain-containing protein n=1 Tax=Diversispora epigaea TaxID=1348612 RepID=A0A397H900_9GLOM|nr:hypothetical protein Glove_396g97 [Diversispora epigaea]
MRCWDARITHRPIFKELYKELTKYYWNFWEYEAEEFSKNQTTTTPMNYKTHPQAIFGWSHYQYPWCKVVICDEHYTSKTCGNCGYLHQKLRSNKTFKCSQCQIEMDRDINAARNILLRYLTLNMSQIDGSRW